MASLWNSEAPRPPPASEAPSVAGLLRHAAQEVGEIIRSEANVIKLELEESTRAMIVDALKATLYSAVALLGLLSLLAFMIVGLADIISGDLGLITRFWASALIIGALFTVAGGLMAVRHAKRIGQDALMRNTRAEFQADKQFIKDEWNHKV